MQESVSLEQDEIDSYRRLRSSGNTSSRVGGLLFPIFILLTLGIAVGVAMYFYDQTNANLAALQAKVENLAFENQGYDEVTEQMFEFSQDLKEIQGEVDRVWNLAAKEQVATFDSIKAELAKQQARLDELQAGLAAANEKFQEQERLQRNLQSLQATLVSLESTNLVVDENIETLYKQDRLLEGRMERISGSINAIDKDRQRRAREFLTIEKRLVSLKKELDSRYPQ